MKRRREGRLKQKLILRYYMLHRRRRHGVGRIHRPHHPRAPAEES